MAVLRTITCDIPGCDNSATEAAPNAGWPGWGGIQGVALNDIPNPNICPECLAKVMAFIDGGMKNGMD